MLATEQEFSVEGYAVPFCSGKPKSLRGDGRRNSSGQDHRDLVRGAFGRDRTAFVFSFFSRPFRLRLFFRNFFSSFLLSAEVEGPLLLQYFSFFFVRSRPNFAESRVEPAKSKGSGCGTNFKGFLFLILELEKSERVRYPTASIHRSEYQSKFLKADVGFCSSEKLLYKLHNPSLQ